MRVLKKTQRIGSFARKTHQLRRVWPKGYKRFDSEKGKEKFEIKPQKYNIRLLLLSAVVLVIIWIFVVQPYIDKNPKKEEPIRVKIFKEDIFSQGNKK